MNKSAWILTFTLVSLLKEPILAKNTFVLETPTPIHTHETTTLELDQDLFYKVSEGVLYFGIGSTLKLMSFFARLGSGLNFGLATERECLLFVELCDHVSSRIFNRMLNTPPIKKHLFLSSNIPPTHSSWYVNQMQLSLIQTFSQEEKQLLLFLKNRWLAKSTGFLSFLINRIYPCLGLSIQTHPETTNSYARSPAINFSQAYKNRISMWKSSLPHPHSFPLILTRPFDLQNYFPSYFEIFPTEDIQRTANRLAIQMQSAESKTLVDFSRIFPNDIKTEDEWLHFWNLYQIPFSKACEKLNINQKEILCIQKVRQENIGGIRLLPLGFSSLAKSEFDHQFLLQWFSTFGLSANRVELDRSPAPSDSSILEEKSSYIPVEFLSKKDFLTYLTYFDQNYTISHPQKTLMLKGTLSVLNGLFTAVTEEKWEEISYCKTKLSITELSFFNIREQLKLLEKEGNSITFFEFTSKLEQIHATLSSLLEVLNPFIPNDFSIIYQKALSLIPKGLKELTSYGIHSSGMTSIAGIFQATKKMLGRPPRILYCENTYYECINAANLISKASFIQEATDKDLEEADLLLAQFNPVWKGTNLQKNEYEIEDISKILHNSLKGRQGKPLTLALDSTFDLINSSKTGQLLNEFQEEIKQGTLNVICYRSGLKFDLFGMDNYCGAPFYTIHSQDEKWTFFDAILKDPVLQADQLSLNWFCLAYQNAPLQLELYQKQIFDNTKKLLGKVPNRLLNKNVNYRIIPIKDGVDPVFIDITVFGPLHQIKTAALVGGYLSVKCIEEGFPLFYRLSVGFHHTNLTMLFGEDCSTIRLTLGPDSDQVDFLAKCFERIDALNDSSP